MIRTLTMQQPPPSNLATMVELQCHCGFLSTVSLWQYARGRCATESQILQDVFRVPGEKIELISSRHSRLALCGTESL
jgi:hypothetical protein